MAMVASDHRDRRMIESGDAALRMTEEAPVVVCTAPSKETRLLSFPDALQQKLLALQ